MMTAIMTLMPFYEEIMTVHITWRIISNMGWPHITPVCLVEPQPRALKGW